MALDVETIGAAMNLLNGSAASANAAAAAANAAADAANAAAELAEAKAGLADDAAGAANTAAAGANAYAGEYKNVDADIRMIFSQTQAYIRWLEKRVSTLEATVAAMAG